MSNNILTGEVGLGVGEDDLGSAVGETASVQRVLQQDVSLLSPVGGPRVLDQPVGVGSTGVVASQLDAVID
jgi:hypothetical protein